MAGALTCQEWGGIYVQTYAYHNQANHECLYYSLSADGAVD